MYCIDATFGSQQNIIYAVSDEACISMMIWLGISVISRRRNPTCIDSLEFENFVESAIEKMSIVSQRSSTIPNTCGNKERSALLYVIARAVIPLVRIQSGYYITI